MNTLNKNVTKEFYRNADGYQELERTWSAMVNDRELRKTLGCEHHLLYQMLRGKDWRKSITSITNKRKLENGAVWNWRGGRAIWSVRNRDDVGYLLAPFADVLAVDAIERLRALLSEYRWPENPAEKEAYVG
jgi:hypothetical protein